MAFCAANRIAFNLLLGHHGKMNVRLIFRAISPKAHRKRGRAIIL
jgi:hypothetical protein